MPIILQWSMTHEDHEEQSAQMQVPFMLIVTAEPKTSSKDWVSWTHSILP
jgi:hypothetical protein